MLTISFYLATMTARQLTKRDSELSISQRWAEVLDGDKSGFEICMVPKIGRGIKTTRKFEHNEILMRYFGDVISEEEACRREALGPDEGHFYMYKFIVKEKTYVLDATREDGTYGRLINHSKKRPNVRAKPMEIDGVPAIVFVPITELEVGVELRYDYGERRKHVIEKNPWLLK